MKYTKEGFPRQYNKYLGAHSTTAGKKRRVENQSAKSARMCSCEHVNGGSPRMIQRQRPRTRAEGGKIRKNRHKTTPSNADMQALTKGEGRTIETGRQTQHCLSCRFSKLQMMTGHAERLTSGRRSGSGYYGAGQSRGSGAKNSRVRIRHPGGEGK